MEKNPQWLDLDDESSMVFLKAHQNNDNSESRKKKFPEFFKNAKYFHYPLKNQHRITFCVNEMKWSDFICTHNMLFISL